MSPDQLQSLLALALGFAFAGFMAAGYQLLAERPLSFRLLGGPGRTEALAAVPLLVFGAPFVIMRNTVRGRRFEQRRITPVAIATAIAGFWSLMSGTVVATGWLGLVRLMA